MKKIMIILFFFGAVWAYGMNTCLIITSPKPGDTWFKGETRTISWINQGNKSAGVKINIFRNSINQANFVQQLTSGGIGPVMWNIPKNLASGTYFLRIKTNDGSCMEDSPGFMIQDKVNMIPVSPVDPDPPPVHRAPPLVEPSGASFTIKSISYHFTSPGILGEVSVVIRYSSKTSFSFDNYGGGLTDGPAYLNCKISIPRYPMNKNYSWIPAENGSVYPEVVFNHRLAVKYTGNNHLECIPKILNAGNGEFELVFTPDKPGSIKGLLTNRKMKGAIASPSDLCKKYHYPILELRTFFHTKEGVRSDYKKFYLDRADVNSIMIPGEISMCTSGIIYW